MNEEKIADFRIIERSSVKVLEWADGSCRPATSEEIILSVELTRLREENEKMRELLEESLHIARYGGRPYRGDEHRCRVSTFLSSLKGETT